MTIIPYLHRVAEWTGVPQAVSRTVIKRREDAMERVVEAIPKYRFTDRHVQGCKTLVDRDALLNHLPKAGVVAELGVDNGAFSRRILDIAEPSKLYLVDLWGTKRYGETKANTVRARYEAEIESGQVEIRRGLSTERLADFEDGSLDWVYIDTDHTYATTLEELRLCAQKVKPTGFIAGHDYVAGNLHKGYKYGVIEAVTQFCVEAEWRLAYLTANFDENNSFCIVKI